MTKVFYAGLPTELDVRKLLDAFGVPAIGTVLSHDEIAAAIGVKPSSVRYRTVVTAWRKKLEVLHQVRLGADRGRGFKSLDERERIDESTTATREGLRKVARAATRAASVDTDDAQLRTRRDVLVRFAAHMKAEANRQLKPPKQPTPAEPPPRLSVVGKKAAGGS